MFQGRPLYDNPVDRRYYVQPPEWAVMARAVDRGNNTLIYGSRGSGKTTLLRQQQMALREAGKHVAFVDGSAVASPLELATRVREALKGRLNIESDAQVSAALATIAGDRASPPGGASRLLHDMLISLGQDTEPAIVLLDASGSAQALYGLFGRMRDTIWQLPHRWLVTMDEDDLATALKPPADAFFDSVIALAPLPAEDLALLLKKRTEELRAGTLAEIAAEARGNPRAAIRAANEAVVRGESPAFELQTRGRLIDEATRLGRPHGTLMAELLEIGQASPSDEKLLKRLGLTRARVSTLMQQMQRAGLLESAVERSDRPGRPRTIYRPALRGVSSSTQSLPSA